MPLLTIAFLSLFIQNDILNTEIINSRGSVYKHQSLVVDIDSMDRVIFDLDQIVGHDGIIEIPVFIDANDLINSLDFSMSVNLTNLEFESVVDHTGELQYAAFLNPNDLKLRFTSNSFSPYPIGDKVVSIRFRPLSELIYKADFESVIAYLNGDKCSTEVAGADFVSGSDEVVVNEIFVTPNPVSDMMFIDSEEGGLLDMFDAQGSAMMLGYRLSGHTVNSISVGMFPRGSYTVRIISEGHFVKTQQIVLQ